MSLKFLKPEKFKAKLDSLFSEVKSRVLKSIPRADVQHIGSSAIKNAISKGDLDILVRVDSAIFDESLKAIQSLGFQIKEGTLRTESLCMLITTEFGEDVAIQLIARGSEFEDFIRFRDLLNQDADLVEKYNQLKMKCEGLSPDDYRALKSKFIESVLRR